MLRTGYLEIFNTTPIWPGGYTDKLMGYPMCGWDGEFCLVPEDNGRYPSCVDANHVLIDTIYTIV